MDHYRKWIDLNYPTRESAHNQCLEATAAMQREFPELERVKGFVRVYNRKIEPHWWCLTPEGRIVDPTAHQYESPFIEYRRLRDVTYRPGDIINTQTVGEMHFKD